MCMWELSTETNRIETAVVRFGVATIFATVKSDIKQMGWFDLIGGWY